MQSGSKIVIQKYNKETVEKAPKRKQLNDSVMVEGEYDGMAAEVVMVDMVEVVTAEITSWWLPMGFGVGSCSWLLWILMLSCIFMGSACVALLSMYFGVIMIGFDSSNQNAGLFGLFTYSTSILPCLLWTILQDWVSPFMFILIKLPTWNILMLIMGHMRAHVLITSVARSWYGWARKDRFWNKGSFLEERLSEPNRKCVVCSEPSLAYPHNRVCRLGQQERNAPRIQAQVTLNTIVSNTSK